MLDKKMAKLDTYRASKKPMSSRTQMAAIAVVQECKSNMARLAERLARDPMVIASLRASEQDIRYNRILSHEEALRQLRRVEVLIPQ